MSLPEPASCSALQGASVAEIALPACPCVARMNIPAVCSTWEDGCGNICANPTAAGALGRSDCAAPSSSCFSYVQNQLPYCTTFADGTGCANATGLGCEILPYLDYDSYAIKTQLHNYMVADWGRKCTGSSLRCTPIHVQNECESLPLSTRSPLLLLLLLLLCGTPPH